VLISDDEPLKLPPKREIEHEIPMNDETIKRPRHVYKVAEKQVKPFSDLWDQHVQAGIWVLTSAENMDPVMPLEKWKATSYLRLAIL